jgi:hypothetical protein
VAVVDQVVLPLILLFLHMEGLEGLEADKALWVLMVPRAQLQVEQVVEGVTMLRVIHL